MKRLVCVFLLTTGLMASARQITSDEALTFASDFMNSTELQTAGSSSKSLRAMRAPGVDANASVSAYYVINRGENDGFVIISGDDRAPKILGYSDKGSFDAENLPPQLKSMMEQWSVQMGKLPDSAPRHGSWSKSLATRTGEGVLMETAEWGQGYPYNALCPVIDGEQAPTGCIATAMAIAMKYHNWPDYTRGEEEEDFECKGVSFDFSSYKIDWDILSDKENPKFAEEVSKLHLSLGVAAQMQYGPYESVAYDWPYAHKMIEKYFYAKGCQFIEKSSFSDSEWRDLIQTQLSEVGPVIYRGSGDGIGHAFVVDGYDGTSLYHVNWGWDGLLNGYYTLDFADMGFDNYNGMVINIIPDKERHVYSKAFIPNVQAYIGGSFGCGDWNFMNPDIKPGEPNRVRIPDYCLNLHRGAFGIGVVDEDDNILEILDGFTYNDGYREVCPWPGGDDAFNIVFPELKKGERFQLVSQEIPSEIYPGYVPVHQATKDPKDWQIVLGGMVRPSHFYMTGNRSEISEVNFHIDEKLPFMFKIHSKCENEFTIRELKGHYLPDNVEIPMNGVTIDVKCYDKNGNPEDQVVAFGDFMETGYLSFNISMYSDRYDVYLNYEYDGDTRRDGGIEKDLIIEQDGLVYKIEDEGVTLIGYDNVPETVVIPDYLMHGGSKLPVLKVGQDALLFAPIKKLIIQCSQLNTLEGCSFAGMESLKTISFEDARLLTNTWRNVFLKTNVETVYFDNVNELNFISQLMNLSFGNDESFTIGNRNIDFYLGDLAGIEYGLEIGEFNMLRDYGAGQCLKSFNVPGIGDIALRSILMENPVTPVVEMWNYSIDKKNGLFSIKDVMDNIQIERVMANGIEVNENSFGLFEVPNYDGNNFDVAVEYTVNGERSFTTHYNGYYNNLIEDSQLRPVILGDSNNDGILNIADAVNAANYIVDLPTTDFVLEMADMNADGEITVYDVTSIISLIPAQTYVGGAVSSQAMVKSVPSGYLVSSFAGEGKSELCIDSNENLTAIQFDVCVPTGLSVPEFKLSEAFSASHLLEQFRINDNTSRIIVYSVSGKLLTNLNNDPVLKIDNADTLSEVIFENIFAADACGASCGLEYENAGWSNSVLDTGIASEFVKVIGDSLIIKNAKGSAKSVYSLDGASVGQYASEEENIEIPLSAGMYIVKVGNRSYKVIIK